MAASKQKSEEECEFCKQVSGAEKKPYVLTRTGKILIGISGTVFVGFFAVTTPFFLPAVRRVCLPYVPATTQQLKNVMTALNGRSGRLVDLGSGDGRIVVEAAKKGFSSDGVELNPWLVWYSRLAALRQGYRKNTQFYRKDLWKFDLSPYENVVIFGVEQMMPKLEQKLCENLSDQARVIACRFPLPNWQPFKTIGSGVDTVWLYQKTPMKKT